MPPFQVDLSCERYPTDGTNIAPTGTHFVVEPPDEILALLTQALRRRLRLCAQRNNLGDRILEYFLGDDYEFFGGLPRGYTHVRYTANGRRDIRIYGHHSGKYFRSAKQFMPHAVALMLCSERCWCDFCKE